MRGKIYQAVDKLMLDGNTISNIHCFERKKGYGGYTFSQIHIVETRYLPNADFFNSLIDFATSVYRSFFFLLWWNLLNATFLL